MFKKLIIGCGLLSFATGCSHPEHDPDPDPLPGKIASVQRSIDVQLGKLRDAYPSVDFSAPDLKLRKLNQDCSHMSPGCVYHQLRTLYQECKDRGVSSIGPENWNRAKTTGKTAVFRLYQLLL